MKLPETLHIVVIKRLLKEKIEDGINTFKAEATDFGGNITEDDNMIAASFMDLEKFNLFGFWLKEQGFNHETENHENDMTLFVNYGITTIGVHAPHINYMPNGDVKFMHPFSVKELSEMIQNKGLN